MSIEKSPSYLGGGRWISLLRSCWIDSVLDFSGLCKCTYTSGMGIGLRNGNLAGLCILIVGGGDVVNPAARL